MTGWFWDGEWGRWGIGEDDGGGRRRGKEEMVGGWWGGGGVRMLFIAFSRVGLEVVVLSIYHFSLWFR